MKTGRSEEMPRAVVGEGLRIAWPLFYTILLRSQKEMLGFIVAYNFAIAVFDVFFKVNIAQNKGCPYARKA